MAEKITSRVLRYGMLFGDAFISIVYPTACRVCGSPVGSLRDGVACANCWEAFDLNRLSEEVCSKCGVSLPGRSGLLITGSRRCGRCDELAFDLARACGPYQGAMKESVLRLKTQPHMPGQLKMRIIAVFRQIEAFHSIDSILPVPLHPKRLAERAFNQSEVIAETLAAETGLPIDRSSLIRIRATRRHRAGMSPIERARSMKNAFHLRAPRLIENRSVLLVDDVMTTGSTAHEIALVLGAGGASKVSVLALARARETFGH